MVVVNARYFPQLRVHMLNGFTTNKAYTAAYNEVITEISKFAKNIAKLMVTHTGSNITT